MSDEDEDSKTEDPSDKKIQDAIKKGNVVNSKEVTSFAVLLSLTIIVSWILPNLVMSLIKPMRYFIEKAGDIRIDFGVIASMTQSIIGFGLIALAPIFGIVIIAIIIAFYSQHGQLVFSAESLKPDISKLSIIKGFGRIFSKKGLVEFVKQLCKIGIVGFCIYLVVMKEIKYIPIYHELSITSILGVTHALAGRVLRISLMVMAGVAALDYLYQKHNYMKSLRMTKHEMKEEWKESEGNPEIKSKLYQKRQEISQRRMQQTVPNSTAVITNPQHYSVVLQYDFSPTSVPKVVEKGLDSMALKIQALAREHDVPIIEDPPLARGLYHDVGINKFISQKYYQPVAQIMAYVNSLNEKRAQQKKSNI
ncbi:Flagellar biosynthetic protein FlhB [Rickettsiales endosymbiont of Paramecium tredecaurelia]|uniref:EscU/YscU/HrcU family type III secretion system export apparatus switch protein n=1 Tax=Candidatus Sarmatiella mevalonica TaxID=2770581 RepID=UPI0019208641|nr:flagellar type III secretion system protein FlhB [Candidatus Sarmatiella mevalonica]MBL3285082.1 Flagellar biosynthetic protein FlhB [Candidatus Sarmatiella mevalonica]